jgi:hypothetical protein
LDDIFTWQEQRSVSQALTLQYDKVLYLIEPSPENQKLVGKRVTVIDYPDNRLRIEHEAATSNTGSSKSSPRCTRRRSCPTSA